MEIDAYIGQHIVACLMSEQDLDNDPVLNEWIASKESNHSVFQEYEKIWKESQKISKMNQFDAVRAWTKVNEANRRKAKIHRRMQNMIYMLSGMAASVLLVFALSLTGVFRQAETPIVVEMKTNYGNRSEIVLPDGSVVKLNAGSKIDYYFNPENETREVAFQGEGFFNVSKNNAPFIITTSTGLQVKVLGTTFNLSAYPDDPTVQTTLVEGNIELHYAAQSLTLAAGQMAVFDNSFHTISYAEGELSHTYGWLSNKLYIEDMSLTEVCKRLERWYDVDITIGQDIGDQIHYSGVLREETINDVLEALCQLSKIKYQIKGKNINISPK